MRSFFLVVVTAAFVVGSMAESPATGPGQADKKQPDPCTVSGRVVAAEMARRSNQRGLL